MEFHSLANLFPLIQGAEFDDLTADIAANGLLEAIITYDGKILDGRNRFLACEASGVKPRFEGHASIEDRLDGDEHFDLWACPVCNGTSSDSTTECPHCENFKRVLISDPVKFVVSHNLRRRHMDEQQRGIVAARLATLADGQKKSGAQICAASQQDAAEMLNVSRRTVQYAREVITEGVPTLIDAVEQGGVAISTAATVSKLPKVQQAEIVARGKPAIMAAAKAFKAEDAGKKKVARAQKEQALAAATVAASERIGSQTYGLIYADPPWRFEPYSRETGMDRAPENHYPTEPTEVIAGMKIPAAENCVLFLWATAPMLPDALAVMNEWGFSYKSHVIWAKNRIGTGYWARNKHELLLIGTRGSIPAPSMGDQPDSVIEAPVGAHSAKPAVFAELLERLFPTLPKLEMFCRSPRDGWDVWGNQSEGVAA